MHIIIKLYKVNIVKQMNDCTCKYVILTKLAKMALHYIYQIVICHKNFPSL